MNKTSMIIPKCFSTFVCLNAVYPLLQKQKILQPKGMLRVSLFIIYAVQNEMNVHIYALNNHLP